MPVTALLVRWNGGWYEIDDPAGIAAYDRKGGFLSHGAIQSEAESRRMAAAELAGTLAHLRVSHQAEHRPASIVEAPYVAYRPGDTINLNDGATTVGVPVVAMTVVQDDDGVVTFVPELGDVSLDFEERVSVDVRKMTPGAFAGRVRSSTAAVPVI